MKRKTGKHKILVVDDERSIIEVLDMLLSSQGYEILTAQNAREALKLIERRRGKLALMLLDIHMPEVSGEELLYYVRIRERIGGGDRLPVLILSGVLTESLVARLIESGADGVLAKPLNTKRVLRAVEGVLDTAGRGTKPGEEKVKPLKDILEDPALEDVGPIVSRLRELRERIDELDRKLGEYPEDEGLISEAMSVDDYVRKVDKLRLGVERKQLREEYQEATVAMKKIEQGFRGLRDLFEDEEKSE